jgi:hypothetical protein
MRRTLLILSFLVLVIGTAGSTLARPKTDVVHLINGDRITGEIKEMTRGKLKYSTDSEGTIYVEWADIVSLKSDYYYRVEARDGKRYHGTLDMKPDTRVLRVVGTRMIASLDEMDVVEITSIKQGSFWETLDGSLSLGYSFTKASDVAQLTFDWTNVYVTEKNLFDFKWKQIYTDTRGDSVPVAERIDIAFTYNRLLRLKWTGNTSISYQRNDELDLANRILLNFGMGATPLKDNHNLLILSSGLALNLEQAVGEREMTTSAEFFLSGNYALFQYNTPKTDVNTSLEVFFGITERNRVRANYDLKGSREIVSDFFFELSFYYSYDNQPASGGGAAKDYGIVTGIGWKY